MAGRGRRAIIIASLSFFSPQTTQSAILLGKTARWRRHFYFALHFILARKHDNQSNNENGPARRCPNHQNKNADGKWVAIRGTGSSSTISSFMVYM